MGLVRAGLLPSNIEWLLGSTYIKKILLNVIRMWFELVTAPGIFLRIFLKKYKLYNLIKREIHILKKKKNTQIHKVCNCLLRVFYILKSMHDSLIINAISYISFNVHNQAIIHPLNIKQIMEQNLILLA